MNHQQQQQHILINGNAGVTSNPITLQHYLVNNHIQKPSDQNQQSQNVHVQIVKQEQAQQRYILNRQYVHQTQSPHVQHEPPIYWVLVEIDSNNELNSYALVESKDIVGQPLEETLSTGNSIVVNINGRQSKATVVMHSDNKNIMSAEFKQLSKMAEENLYLKSREGQFRKRRRISGSDIARKDMDDDSSMSGWSVVSQNINTERILSPSANITQKLTKVESRYVPPMMFDQGVQTDNRMTGTSGTGQDYSQEIQKLIELNEHMLNEQKLLRNEAKTNQLLMQSYTDEFSAMRKSMQFIESKVEILVSERGQFNQIATDSTLNKKKILNGSGTQPYYIIETQEGNANESASLSLNGSNLEYTVEELEADDSGRSTSRMSYHDQTSMMSNSSIDFSAVKKDTFRRSHSSSNFSVHSSSSTPIVTRASSNTNLTEEWADVEGDVVIGSNKTMVPVHVLRAIDWKNYKQSTRKLLTHLFTREILASRSLTGRPSPAFHDRNKPVKGKLDQNIINDIIQIVTRKCSVQESQVRTAITTKCADENKMLRNRKDNEEKEKFKTPSSASGSSRVADKENVANN